MKKVFVFLFILIVLIASVSVIFAGLEIGDLSHSINTEYSPSDYLKGWINITLTNEPVNSLFETNFEDSITLINLLKLNNAVKDDTCVPQDCISDYSASDASATKTFDLGAKESKIIGFKLEGNIDTINSLTFSFNSGVAESCINQLDVDFLNNGIVDIQNGNVSVAPCPASRSYGCFDDTQDTLKATIDTRPHCQKIKLHNFPGFKLGAWVNRTEYGTQNLTMALYDGYQIKANCKLPVEDIPSGGDEIYCGIDYLVKEPKDYYVCIYSDEGTGTYKIEGYPDTQQGCGFHNEPPQSGTSAYNIFAEGKSFNRIGEVDVTNDLFPEKSLETLAEEYLKMKYNSDMDCPDGGCIIPIRFLAEQTQSITVKDLLVNYDISGFDGSTTDFYDLSETPAIINMDFQKLYLDDANFSVTDEYGKKTFALTLNGTEIFSEEISIERIPIIKRLIPTLTASAFPTEFKVIIEEFANITKYAWNFGDGHSKTTTANTIIHTYANEGSYQLNITITDLNQKSAFKTFDVTVGSPEEIVNEMLGKMLGDLGNIITQINKFDLFSKESLNSILDTDSLDTTLAEIQVAKASASPDYNALLTTLLSLIEKIPESVVIGESSDFISSFPDKEIINLDILKMIGGESYDASDEGRYADAILSWNQQHIDTKISMKSFSGRHGQLEEPILKVFNLKIKKKSSLDYNPYLIFPELDNLKFKEEYSETEESGYTFIDLTESDETISFSTTEDISFFDLPVFISPGINKLVIVKTGIFEGEGSGWKLTLFILIVFLLVLIGIIVYIVLQVWYKKRYENYLFKNKNELYNLITYVQNARKKGLQRNEIANKLRKTGWSSERIKYVLKKHAGKRTGMLEIPVETVLTKFKKRAVPKNQKGLVKRGVQRRKFFKK